MKRVNLFSITYKSIAIACGILLLSACTKDYETINSNKNAVTSIGETELPFLFSKAQSSAVNSAYNYQVAQNLFADQYAQYFACVATYFPSDRLVIRMDWVGAAFNPMYTDVLPQLQTIFSKKDPSSTEYALASIWWVYTFHRVTDYWGPIPYFSVGQVGTSVAYDPQDKIYDDFFKRLTAAVTVLQNNPNDVPFGSYDLIYGGDVSKWIKLANTLRLRLALRISKVDPTRAKTEAEAAVAAGVMSASPDDDAFVARSSKGNDYNGLSIMSPWNEFRMSASMESVLKGYKDPRISEYYIPSLLTGDYEGLSNGLTSAQLTDESGVNTANANSHVGLRFADSEVKPNPDYDPIKGGNKLVLTGKNSKFISLETPQNVAVTAEAYFLRAEGALLGWNMNGTAKELYETGIKNSLIQWGITNSDTIQTYISGTTLPVAPNDFLQLPPMTNIPVAFSSDINVQKEQIATQKWLALFPDGMEAWADYRRSHVLKLYPVANSDNPDIGNTSTQWIRRIPFLLSETQNNGPAVQAAVGLLGGPDKVTTPLWWDKN